MKFSPTALSEVMIIEPTVFNDDRGYFFEIRQQQKFSEAGITLPFVQDNMSRSKRGVIRGLHYQVQQPQGKLVRVVAGKVFDVAVDIRRNSPTFGKWISAILSAENNHQIWVPPGFAHGFYVLSDFADVIYCCTDFYAPQYERTIIWNDPELAINWPLIDNEVPILSPKDAQGLLIKNSECYNNL